MSGPGAPGDRPGGRRGPRRQAGRGLLAALLLLAPALSAPAPDAGGEPLPDGLLWRARDPGTGHELYLLGSVHVLRPADLPLPAPVLDAYRSSSLLVLELDMDAIAPGVLESTLLEFGTAAPTRPLRVAAGDAWPGIRSRLEAAGYDPGALDRFDPWFVSTAVVNRELAVLGFRADLGVESQLADRARRDGRPISGLETISEQLGIFESLDSETQTVMLSETLGELDELDTLTDRTIGAWRRGDVPALRQELAESFEHQPTLYELLVAARNRNWVPALLALLETADTELVVVGALHVIGEESVVALLREAGLQLEALW